MSQNDYVIANQTTPLFRTDLNLALQALASNSSGSTAPTTTYANMMWYDTTANILKMRNEADSAWISLGTLDQGANTFTPAGVIGTSADADFTVDPAKLATRATIDTFVTSAIAAAPSGSLTLLATQATTTGTSYTVSGLDLTGYKGLRIRLNDVDFNSGFSTSCELFMDGQQIANAIFGVDGVIISDLLDGYSYSIIAGVLALVPTTLTTASTSVTFSCTGTGAVFNAGTIYIYGVN